MSASAEYQSYIQEKVAPVLEAMVTNLLLERPSDPVPYMMTYLQKQFDMPSDSTAQLQEEIRELKEKLASLEKASKTAGVTKPSEGGDVTESEDDDDDEVDELPPPPKNYNAKVRQSVSAEAYGAWNKKEDFTPPSYPKSEEQMERIKKSVGQSFLFGALEKKDVELVISAMQEVKCTKDQTIITEGDDGDCLYVIEKGTLDCYKKIEGEEKLVKTVSEGEVVGELALLYNCPRAATVKARDEATVWSLDRSTFNHIVKDAAAAKRDRYEAFLEKVPILAGIDKYGRAQIADALRSEDFEAGAAVVTQGESGDAFYIVQEGEATAKKKDGDEEKEVMQYASGDYFGELALLKNAPRAATVVCKTQTKLLSLERKTFKRLLGPLEDIMATQAETKYRV